MRLDGARVIVTGGGGGIGSALSRMLLERGAEVGAVDRSPERLSALVAAHGTGKLRACLADVGRFDEVERTVADLFDAWGRIDGLVNNAAILEDGPLVGLLAGRIRKHSIEGWRETLSSNLDSVFYCTREVVERMVMHRTRGVIVNVSSISASGNAGQTAYAASKGAVDALTVTWARELAPLGIRVAGVAPGMTDTAMPREAMTAEALDAWVGKTPLRRLASPTEVAEAIVFVLESDYMCGRTLQLDGGLRM